MDGTQTPAKRCRVEEGTCIICAARAPLTELTKPKDPQSIESLQNAARIQHFDAILNLCENEYDSKLWYHRNCRSSFTHKKTLASFSTKEDPSAGTDPRKSCRDGPSSSRVMDQICIFCDKKTKYITGSKTREPLMQSLELRSDAKVRQAAIGKLDNKMLAITSRNIVAAEAHYHKTCYRNYTRDEKPKAVTANMTNEDVAYQEAEQESYLMLFKHIRDTMFTDPQAVRLTHLTDTLVEFMRTYGYDDVKKQTKNHIRRKLDAEFCDSLHFISETNGRVLVYPDNLSLAQALRDNVILKDKVQELESTNDIRHIINQSAVHIRGQIKSMPKMPWPPKPDELNADYLKLPETLMLFLRNLLMGDSAEGTPRLQRVVQSLGQDCVYAVSGGSTIPAKHILLPWGVKSLTGNVEVIRVLNRLGHSISYSKLEELDTVLCLQKQAQEADKGVILPSTSHPCVPTALAFDNIDRLEETLSGGGTSHRVNGIIVQPQVSTARGPQKEVSVVTKKSRSIPPVPLDVPEYNAGTREGPPSTRPVAINHDPEMKSAQRKNIFWSLARMTHTAEQLVCSWTGFNIMTRDNITVCKDTVGYLPTINAPATKLSTVREILNHIIKIMKALDIDEIVCIFDQALYAKASEIIWKHQMKFKPIVLRMGTFHTLMNLISIIGKRFGSAGLRDIAVECGIIAEGSISGVLGGRSYNRGVRLCKLVYEALLRLAWKRFNAWLEANHMEDVRQLTGTTQAITEFTNNVSSDGLETAMQDQSVSTVILRFEEFLSHLRTSHGQLAAFWMSFVDLVDMLLGLIRASREGNWPLHLASIRSFIPWCFAYDKQNYARYTSVYYSQMTQLAETHPEVHVAKNYTSMHDLSVIFFIQSHIMAPSLTKWLHCYSRFTNIC